MNIIKQRSGRWLARATALLSIALLPATAWVLDSLEVPAKDSTMSGVLYVSGWKCPRQGKSIT